MAFKRLLSSRKSLQPPSVGGALHCCRGSAGGLRWRWGFFFLFFLLLWPPCYQQAALRSALLLSGRYFSQAAILLFVCCFFHLPFPLQFFFCFLSFASLPPLQFALSLSLSVFFRNGEIKSIPQCPGCTKSAVYWETSDRLVFTAFLSEVIYASASFVLWQYFLFI